MKSNSDHSKMKSINELSSENALVAKPSIYMEGINLLKKQERISYFVSLIISLVLVILLSIILMMV